MMYASVYGRRRFVVMLNFVACTGKKMINYRTRGETKLTFSLLDWNYVVIFARFRASSELDGRAEEGVELCFEYMEIEKKKSN